jgi:hypothetical protein
MRASGEGLVADCRLGENSIDPIDGSAVCSRDGGRIDKSQEGDEKQEDGVFGEHRRGFGCGCGCGGKFERGEVCKVLSKRFFSTSCSKLFCKRWEMTPS